MDWRRFLFHQITGNLGFDFRIDQTIDGADPFAENRDVLLLDAGHQNLQGFEAAATPVECPHAVVIRSIAPAGKNKRILT